MDIDNYIVIKYTKEQKRAIAQLRKAFTMCKKTGLFWFNQYGTLQFFPNDEIKEINDSTYRNHILVNQHDVEFEEINLKVGEWSDDTHYVHFTKKGKRKYLKGD